MLKFRTLFLTGKTICLIIRIVSRQDKASGQPWKISVLFHIFPLMLLFQYDSKGAVPFTALQLFDHLYFIK